MRFSCFSKSFLILFSILRQLFFLLSQKKETRFNINLKRFYIFLSNDFGVFYSSSQCFYTLQSSFSFITLLWISQGENEKQNFPPVRKIEKETLKCTNKNKILCVLSVLFLTKTATCPSPPFQHQSVARKPIERFIHQFILELNNMD